MRYIVTYKIKWDDTSKETHYWKKEGVLFLIKQLQRWIISIDSKIIVSNFEDFETFQIIEQNYDQKDSKWKCITIEIDKNWDPDINDCINPYRKDITNQLLNERKVSSEKIWNIFLKDNTIYVLWNPFLLTNWSKEREILEMLLKIKKEKKSNFLDYEDIEKYYKRNEKSFKELRYK